MGDERPLGAGVRMEELAPGTGYMGKNINTDHVISGAGEIKVIKSL